MKQNCDLIKDLLPLYAEDMVSTYTSSLVQEHLKECPDCQRELSRLKKPMTVPAAKNAAPLAKIKKAILLKKVRAIVLTAALMAALALSAFSFLTTPEYIPYSAGLITAATDPEGNPTLAFSGEFTRYSYDLAKTADGRSIFLVSAYTTRLDKILNTPKPEALVLPPPKTGSMEIYYTLNGTGSENGSDGDVFIGGMHNGRFTTSNTASDVDSSGVIQMPRLALSYYFLLAGVVFLILAVAYLITLVFFRRKQAVRLWLLRGMLLPLSYMIGHFCVKGISFLSYHMARDFCLIVAVAALLYLALLFGLDLLRGK